MKTDIVFQTFFNESFFFLWKTYLKIRFNEIMEWTSSI